MKDMVVSCAIQKAQEVGQKNIAEMLTIIATLPVTSCEAERSFSRLRYLKTDLRSTMGQERYVFNLHHKSNFNFYHSISSVVCLLFLVCQQSILLWNNQVSY